MTGIRASGRAAAIGALLSATVLGVGTATAAVGAPAPGAAGLGDRIFPMLGNGGYTVTHYTLDFAFRDTRHVDAVVTLDARATQALSRFDLDYDAGPVGSVAVDGAAARWRQAGQELVVTPRRPLADRSAFRVRVRYRTGPRPFGGAVIFPSWPWFLTADGGSVVAAQPNTAHKMFPSNDHPSDKATFAFHVTAPSALTVVANGVLAGRRVRGATTVWDYRMNQPMATELVQLAVGPFAVRRRPGPHGVVIRDVFSRGQGPELTRLLRPTPEHLRWMEGKVGRYPFPDYGILEADAFFGFALETQTLSLFPSAYLPRLREFEPLAVHELAHQWFGDSVSPATWSDVWLNEGHATWYQFAYAEHLGGAGLTDTYRSIYEQAAAELRRRWGPVARPWAHNADELFNDNVYVGGALALFALRQKVGVATFERIEREWVHTYQGRSAGTGDFIRLASRVAGRNLRPFLHSWLYDLTLPPMPGHPDWHAAQNAASGPAADVGSALSGPFRHDAVPVGSNVP